MVKEDNKTPINLGVYFKIVSFMDTNLYSIQPFFVYEKHQLYNDFIQSLFHLIFDTYMGDDVTNSKEQKNHFNWCWRKNVNNFKEEGLYIDSENLYKYFFDFTNEVYYVTTNKEDNKHLTNNILKLWWKIFDLNGKKNKNDLNTFKEIYTLFDDSFQNFKKISEIVR